ncbi:LytR C-terminal domain-containing protein [Gordonia sp. (in: high G+C Gram-positive bacteria)]|uniref:LytR C-terminal domain-containing protein n=1 Tax=Gordonia sp. (in: high G+C Gram-positive bacteria) TaxID=84139 RepID=UPI0025C1B3EE|nr:LytR C-terminal domain-containing protein [Gordonia sp. (in: high G+C Gram-positive bacteria)]
MLNFNNEFQSDAELAPARTYSSTATWSAPSSGPTAPSTEFAVCVLNAGPVTGLSGRYKSRLEFVGYTVSESGNLSTASLTENTVFYDGPAQEVQAKEIAIAIDGIAVERPATFTRCAGQIVVAVVE